MSVAPGGKVGVRARLSASDETGFDGYSCMVLCCGGPGAAEARDSRANRQQEEMRASKGG